MSQEKPQLPTFYSLLYGGIAGCVAKTVICPFDRVKIHFQVAHPELHEFRGRFYGVFGAVRHIYKTSGLPGLFRGHSATLARIFPYAAINFAAFEQFKELLGTKQSSKPWTRLVAGSMAGTVAVAFTYPFDIIRARIAYKVAHDPKESSQLIIKTIGRLAEEGKTFSLNRLGGFYQGFVPTILGIIPYAGVSFFTFESIKQYLKSKPSDPYLSSGQTFMAGLFAGACGQTVAYPFDVLRRRMQLFRATEHLPHHHYNSGIVHAIKSIMNTHGLFRGIFAGLSINYLKVAPASGISFLVYETLKHQYPKGFTCK